jgi:hypothetical protein
MAITGNEVRKLPQNSRDLRVTGAHLHLDSFQDKSCPASAGLFIPSGLRSSAGREPLSQPVIGQPCFRNACHVRSATRRRSSAGNSRPRTSCANMSAKAARSCAGINRIISSMMPPLEDDDALLVCHSYWIDAVRSDIVPELRRGIFEDR